MTAWVCRYAEAGDGPRGDGPRGDGPRGDGLALSLRGSGGAMGPVTDRRRPLCEGGELLLSFGSSLR
ncbi:hypothetical protein Acy02nite_87710 [Actinoplanes cyaneus]|uniref:Uncharacterized protein n=1 Tax=Actinoplanes cyaneus TaxID=52696 RepID=A0A919IRH9_9ACTN|nr:hypothetical protein Acy02nite_87710 [Actinoplanes cyaneus]